VTAPMAPLVFKPDRSRFAARRIFGGVLAVGGGGFGCVLLVIGVVLTPVFLGAAKSNHGALWGLMLPFSGLLFVIVFCAFGAVLAFQGAGDRVRLDDRSIAVTSGKRTTAISLSDIAGLGSRFICESPRTGHWALIITGSSGATIELSIGREGYLALFDVQAILTQLFPLLPATVQIDPVIRAYAATGRIFPGLRAHP
jgi:hypothetical protein